MAMKSIILLVTILLVFVLVMASQAEAQLLSGLLGMININGTVFCSANGNANTNAPTQTPRFANALVQISCNGNVVSSTTTNGSGVFRIFLNPVLFLVNNLLSSCNVVVASPLSSCNSSLSTTGILQAPLERAVTVVDGILTIFNIIIGNFQFLQI